jgi:hypothetical protein
MYYNNRSIETLSALHILTRAHAQDLREQLDRWMVAHDWDVTPTAWGARESAPWWVNSILQQTFERITGNFRALRAFRQEVLRVG